MKPTITNSKLGHKWIQFQPYGTGEWDKASTISGHTYIYIYNYTVIWDVSLWEYHSVDRLMGEYNGIHNQQLQYDVGLFENKGAAKLWLF